MGWRTQVTWGAVLVRIPPTLLEGLISKTKFAISMKESRYTLNGGLLILKPDTLAMVATDGPSVVIGGGVK